MNPLFFLLYLASFKAHTQPVYYQPVVISQPAPMQVAGPGLVFPACTTTVVGKAQTVTVCR